MTAIITSVNILFFTKPDYDSRAKLYIMTKGQVEYNDLSVSTNLTRDYVEIINDTTVLKEVSKQIGGKYSASEIKRSLNVERTDGTRVVEITVTTHDPKDSKEIADAICRVSQERIVDIMGLDNIKVLSYGSLAEKPSTRQVFNKAFSILGVGVILAVILEVFLYSSNNTVSSSEQVEKYLGLNVLATIPYNFGKNK